MLKIRKSHDSAIQISDDPLMTQDNNIGARGRI